MAKTSRVRPAAEAPTAPATAREAPDMFPRSRLEALTDGIYAIALTLLVLELKLPALPHGGGDAALSAALIELLPKALTWLLSFWVMAQFWMSHVRLFRMTAALDAATVRIELVQLALVSLLPFSTAVMGEHGTLPSASALYAGHLLAAAAVGRLRTEHVLRRAELHASDEIGSAARVLRARGWVFVGCATAAFALAFVVPVWNMLALLPMVAVPLFARRTTKPGAKKPR